MMSTHKLLFFTICIVFQLCCMDKSDHKVSVFKAYLFDRHRVPTSAFKDVLGTLNVKHNGTAISIVKETQKFCHTHKECHEIEENKNIPEKTLLPCLERLGVWNEKRPQQTNYEGIIVTDAHEIDWQVRRIKFLHDLAVVGDCVTNAVYFCKSENVVRAFDSKYLEQLVAPFAIIQSNYDRLLFRVKQERPYTVRDCVTDLLKSIRIPGTLGMTQRIDVVSTMHENGDRPTTMDNVQNFLKEHPKDGLYCIISDQPHVAYQEIIFRLAALRAKKLVEFEGVGSRALTCAQGGLNTGQQLDRLARYIRTEDQYVQEYQKTLMQVSEKS